MAILSFNPSRIRHPLLQTHIPISNFTCLTEFPFQSLAKSPKNKLKSVHHLPSCSVSEASISSTLDAEDDPTAELVYLDPEIDPQSITEWELDFCSRPILDIRGKKLWELVVCDNSLSLQYTKYFPNNVINSITLKDALVSISDDLGVPLPDKIRFFRSQMQTIITRACNELGIKPVPSKRCLSLVLWLEDRYETLPVSAVREEVSNLETRLVFGASLDLDLLGIEIEDNTLIPGLAVSSSRAKPLAEKRVEKRVVKALLITAIEFVQSSWSCGSKTHLSWSCGFLKQRWFCSQIDEITVIIDENRGQASNTACYCLVVR
ncbi:hypothetical protein K7X08_029887 [Anisodus acutangulus]|uniref:RNA-binding protein Tab2-like N-terminal domain-containing protein n=1 Tax=Anisodus acutangulus TaxID=402998 RepID=A0A9Q1M430_9SOLA|nr:hypothetical protein K7X08_029887 [Anisodus acutangulus]